MAIRPRSFSGRLLRRAKSKARLEDATIPTPDVPVPSLPPAVKLDASLHLPFGPAASGSAPSSALPIPKKGLHRRSRSFSELLSIASSTTSHDQPWRSREAWAAVHSPKPEPIRKRAEGSVMDRTYGWIERDTDRHRPSPLSEGRRDVAGRQEFRFFHNSQAPPSAIDSDDESVYTPDSGRPHHRAPHSGPANGRSRLNESTTAPMSRCTSGSSSTISTMELSFNPHTPPTSIDTDTPFHPHPHPHSKQQQHGPHSAAPSDESDLPLPPLLPELVKRADSPPAFTRYASPAPWAQRSPMKDVREASNLRWAQRAEDDDTDSSQSSTPPPPPARGLRQKASRAQFTKRHSHQRQRSSTLPSEFGPISPSTETRPESGTLPETGAGHKSNPPRPARHPRRLPPGPVVIVEGETPMPSPPPTSNSGIGMSPMSPRTKGPSACDKPTVPLRSASSQHSLRPTSRRPSTAPEHRQFGFNPLPSPLPSATSSRSSRQGLTDASAARGGWI